MSDGFAAWLNWVRDRDSRTHHLLVRVDDQEPRVAPVEVRSPDGISRLIYDKTIYGNGADRVAAEATQEECDAMRAVVTLSWSALIDILTVVVDRIVDERAGSDT